MQFPGPGPIDHLKAAAFINTIKEGESEINPFGAENADDNKYFFFRKLLFSKVILWYSVKRGGVGLETCLKCLFE